MTIIRPEVTDRSGLSPIKLPALTALELERHISVPEAANIKNISVDTFKRHYAHLIEQVSPRRQSVKLRKLLQEDA
jgi:hypothetical protein